MRCDSYILNRGWIDRAAQHVPTYDEVTGVDRQIDDVVEEQNEAGPSHPWGELDEDEFDDKADEFEAAYNFRFEEPCVCPLLCRVFCLMIPENPQTSLPILVSSLLWYAAPTTPEKPNEPLDLNAKPLRRQHRRKNYVGRRAREDEKLRRCLRGSGKN